MLLPLLLCLLAGRLESTHASYQQSPSDISPQESGMTDLREAHQQTPAESPVVVHLADILQYKVREATADSLVDVTSRLESIQSSLAALTGLASRVEAVEEALAEIQQSAASVSSQQAALQQTDTQLSSQYDTLQKTLSGVSSGQQDLRKTLTAISGKQSDTTNDIASLTEQQQSVREILDALPSRLEIQKTITTHCSRSGLETILPTTLSRIQQALQTALSVQDNKLNDLSLSLTALSDRQEKAQQTLAVLPTRSYIQQTLGVLASRLDWTDTLAAFSKRQQDMQQAFSAHLKQLEDVSQSLAAISDLQQTAQSSLTFLNSQIAGVKQVQFSFSDVQEDVRRTLSTHSGQLDHLAAALSGAPLELGQPAPTAGRVLGQRCRGHSDCTALRADTVCGQQGHCECGRGLQSVAGEMCRPYPRLSDPCRRTSDCQGATDLSVCTDDKCACPAGLFSLNNTECRSDLGIGVPCVHDTDCSTLLGLTCASGTCALRTCDTARTANARYRLVGGNGCDNGYVQFTFNGGKLWQYVCDSDWTPDDASVVCRYMGFGGGAQKVANYTAVDVANFFTVKDYVCSGSESSLSRCRRTYGRDSCSANEMAGVQCYAE